MRGLKLTLARWRKRLAESSTLGPFNSQASLRLDQAVITFEKYEAKK